MFVARAPRSRGPRSSVSRANHGAPIQLDEGMTEIQEELDQTDHICFGWSAAKLALGEFTLEEYFEHLVDHLREESRRHKWDNAKSDIALLLRVDLIGGAFKALLLNRSFRRLSNEGSAMLSESEVLFTNSTHMRTSADFLCNLLKMRRNSKRCVS